MSLYFDIPKRDEIRRSWRKLYNQEFQNSYYLLYIIRIMKARGMRQTGNVARMGIRRMQWRDVAKISGGAAPENF
jgi:hypothetical protein